MANPTISFPGLTHAFAAKPVDPNKAIRIARAADYPKYIWYLVFSLIFVVSGWHIASLLLSRRIRRSGTSRSASEEPSNEKVERTGKISLRRIPSAVASTFRIFAFRWRVNLGGGGSANFAEVGIIVGYLLALLTWEFVNNRNVTTHVDLDVSYWANRAGTIAANQTSLLVALAGKNNIISFLTGISYEKINILHRGAARVVLLMVWIHAWGRWKSGFVADLTLDHPWLRGGILAASSYTLLIIVSIRPIRNAAYELFFYSHLVLVSIILFAAYFHMQQIAGFGYYVWPALLLWAVDRMLRLARIIAFNFPSFHRRTSPSVVAIISADAVRLTVRRRHITWRPGQSVFLIIPEISHLPFESHPFTISTINTPVRSGDKVGEKELVFLIRARNGFTSKLRDVARDASGKSVSVILDGPYGSPPDLSGFSTVVFFAGGSGVSYCLPLFSDIVRRSRDGDAICRRVVFIWSVRVFSHVRWISTELVKILTSAPPYLQLDIRIQVTGLASSDNLPVLEETPAPETPIESNEDLSSAQSKSEKQDKESNAWEEALVNNAGVKIAKGRPDIPQLLDEEISCATGPVSVDVCGPVSLADSVRSALKSEGAVGVLKGRASVTLHVEKFGIA